MVWFGWVVQGRLCCGAWPYAIPVVLGLAGVYAGWLLGVLIYGALRDRDV